MNTIALIATRKGLFKLTDNLTILPVEFLGAPVTMVLASEEHDVWYAALDHGHFGVKLHRSNDQGNSWKEVSAPSYPKAEDPEKKNTAETSKENEAEEKNKDEKGDSLKLIWSLEFAEKNNPDRLLAGTVPGGLFYSDNGGESWQLDETLWRYAKEQGWFGGGFDEAGIHSICVHPDDPNKILIAVSCAGVWATTDGGQSWTNKSKGMRAAFMPPEKQYDPLIQDPHRLVQCPSAPNRLWVQHHNGIFYSDDYAENWQEIESVDPSVFGFGVVVHPNDANKAWFVPGVKDECRIPVDGKFVVTHTKDGGKSFEQQSDGLPLGLSYDLVFRHAMDNDKSGDKILIGSTTGNCWYSDNEGQSWQCLSNYLPPIYAVRFIK